MLEKGYLLNSKKNSKSYEIVIIFNYNKLKNFYAKQKRSLD